MPDPLNREEQLDDRDLARSTIDVGGFQSLGYRAVSMSRDQSDRKYMRPRDRDAARGSDQYTQIRQDPATTPNSTKLDGARQAGSVSFMPPSASASKPTRNAPYAGATQVSRASWVEARQSMAPAPIDTLTPASRPQVALPPLASRSEPRMLQDAMRESAKVESPPPSSISGGGTPRETKAPEVVTAATRNGDAPAYLQAAAPAAYRRQDARTPTAGPSPAIAQATRDSGTRSAPSPAIAQATRDSGTRSAAMMEGPRHSSRDVEWGAEYSGAESVQPSQLPRSAAGSSIQVQSRVELPSSPRETVMGSTTRSAVAPGAIVGTTGATDRPPSPVGGPKVGIAKNVPVARDSARQLGTQLEQPAPISEAAGDRLNHSEAPAQASPVQRGGPESKDTQPTPQVAKPLSGRSNPPQASAPSILDDDKKSKATGAADKAAGSIAAADRIGRLTGTAELTMNGVPVGELSLKLRSN